MYEPKYVRVAAEGQSRDHIVRFGMFHDGAGKSLCGVRPFPSQWEELMPRAEGPLCPECKGRMR